MQYARAMMAIVVDRKGLSQSVINRLAKFVKDSGYLQIAYKSDQEASIRAMLEAAVLQAGREGLQQATPEASAVGESQSNGAAESAVGQLEDLTRTYKAALEDGISQRIPSDHPVIAWLVEHAASVYNRYALETMAERHTKPCMANGFAASWLNLVKNAFIGSRRSSGLS